jgi:predicted nucleic acid-binding protein
LTLRLLDTNILSELKRPNPNHRVVDFVNSCPLDEPYVSIVTLAEIRFGIETAPELHRRAELQQWLANTIRPMFAGRVISITEEIMLRWRVIVEGGQKAGRTFPQPDLIIAATALEYDLAVVTRNVKDFAGLGVTILNPWVQQATP